MNREQMFAKAGRALHAQQSAEEVKFELPDRTDHPCGECDDMAKRVLDAILPQVTTAAELEALPIGSVVHDSVGYFWQHYRTRSAGAGLRWRNIEGSYNQSSASLVNGSPLTVVWTSA